MIAKCFIMEMMSCVKFIRCPIWLHSMLSNANHFNVLSILVMGCSYKVIYMQYLDFILLWFVPFFPYTGKLRKTV